MNIFDAVRELLENRAEEYLHPDDREMLIEALEIQPSVVINITGGVMQGASANMPVDVYSLDFEVPNEDAADVMLVPREGDPAIFGQEAAIVDPAWVDAVAMTPTNGELIDD